MTQKKIPAVFFILFGLFLIIYSAENLWSTGLFGAGFMPTIVGSAIILAAIVDTLSTNKKRVKIDCRDFTVITLFIGLILFYVFMVSYLGFIITSGFVVFPLMLYAARCRVRTSVIISAGAILFIYYFFTQVLLVQLPETPFLN